MKYGNTVAENGLIEEMMSIVTYALKNNLWILNMSPNI